MDGRQDRRGEGRREGKMQKPQQEALLSAAQFQVQPQDLALEETLVSDCAAGAREGKHSAAADWPQTLPSSQQGRRKPHGGAVLTPRDQPA